MCWGLWGFSIAPARVHIAVEVRVLISDLIPGASPPPLRWQKGTNGLFMAAEEHLSYVLLRVRAFALPDRSFPFGEFRYTNFVWAHDCPRSRQGIRFRSHSQNHPPSAILPVQAPYRCMSTQLVLHRRQLRGATFQIYFRSKWGEQAIAQ